MDKEVAFPRSASFSGKGLHMLERTANEAILLKPRSKKVSSLSTEQWQACATLVAFELRSMLFIFGSKAMDPSTDTIPLLHIGESAARQVLPPLRFPTSPLPFFLSDLESKTSTGDRRLQPFRTSTSRFGQGRMWKQPIETPFCFNILNAGKSLNCSYTVGHVSPQPIPRATTAWVSSRIRIVSFKKPALCHQAWSRHQFHPGFFCAAAP